MLTGLKLWNFNSGVLSAEELSEGAFILKTCQRTLVLSFEKFPFPSTSLPEHELHTGSEAYFFLLETICGLKSKLIGENEIVGQFKEAYKAYALSLFKDTKLLRILEKLFKDAKDIRTQYLIGISQKTYASLTRRHFIQRAKADVIVVLGSGQLAEDLINQFKKKAQVILCARNQERVSELARLHHLQVIPWEERASLLHHPFLANTIGTGSILWDETFFQEWALRHAKRLFVDLGSPSVISTPFSLAEGVVRLENIFSEGAIVEEQKREQIERAREAMLGVTQKRNTFFAAKLAPQIAQDMRYL